MLRIATRRSLLSMRQSQAVADAIRSAHPAVEVELVSIVTSGDRQGGPLAPVGGKGLFTAELEAALREGRVQVAVHSAKDLPADMPEDLAIAAVPARQNARDALICRTGGGVEQLPAAALVGTASLRRRALLLACRPDLKVVPIRGNVETRLRKVLGDQHSDLSATVLAVSGLNRSGLASEFAGKIHPMEIETFIPAAGQGALAVQCLTADGKTAALLSAIDDKPSHQSLLAERRVLQALGAGCHSCLAVHVAPSGQRWGGLAMAARTDGSDMMRFEARAVSAEKTADQMLENMFAAGVAELFR